MKWIHPISLRYSKVNNSLWTKSLPHVVLNLSFKTTCKPWERIAIQKKRMRNKRMQVKPTFNAKLTLNVNC